MADTLLHLCTPAQWRAALAAGALAPPSLREAGFVHLSAPGQVALPAQRLFAGRRDLVALAVDPTGLDVRWEPGMPYDPPGLLFPHAYGPVPTSAVVAVLPYRPGPDDFGPPPPPPARSDVAARAALAEPSLLRRAAAHEEPVAGGVAVRTPAVLGSYQHNQLLVDGPVDPDALVADADRVLGGAGYAHRKALLLGAAAATTAAALRERGWATERILRMAATPGGGRTGRVEQLGLEDLRPLWNELWLAEQPTVPDRVLADLTDRYRVEETVVDLRHLAVRAGGTVVACALLKIDGATAELDELNTHPGHRGRGHGDALVAEALALAAEAGCDLVVLSAAADDWPRGWYGRRGFAEVGECWEALRRG